jgi:hypothetical protein
VIILRLVKFFPWRIVVALLHVVVASALTVPEIAEHGRGHIL